MKIKKIIFAFICLCYSLSLYAQIGTTNEIANNPNTSKIPYLKLKNHRVENLIKDLIKYGRIRDDDVLLISFIEENNEEYLGILISRKEYCSLLTTSFEVYKQKIIGYSKIFNHDCYVFSEKAGLFFRKKDSVQIPDYFNWLLSLNQMDREDFVIKVRGKDSEENVEEVRLHVDIRGVSYKYVKHHFIPRRDLW